MDLHLVHDTATGVQLAKQRDHDEVISSPATDITIEHPLDKRNVRIWLYDTDHFLVAHTTIETCEFGEHSPVVTNRYFVHLVLNESFTGTITLEY